MRQHVAESLRFQIGQLGIPIAKLLGQSPSRVTYDLNQTLRGTAHNQVVVKSTATQFLDDRKFGTSFEDSID